MDKTLYITCPVSERGTLLTDKGDEANLAARFGGEKVEVRVRALTPKRSLAANNFYWGVIIPLLMEYTGEKTKEEQHAVLKAHFAAEPHFICNEKTGEIIETKIGRSTASMTKAEFAQYIDHCIELCVDCGIRLPHYEGDRYAYAEHD